MAKDITINNIDYEDVPAIDVPLTNSNGTARYTDVSDTTAEASDVRQGEYFYDANGVRTEGTSTGGSITTEDITSNYTLTPTSGNATNCRVTGARRTGNVVGIVFAFSTTAVTAAGSNVLVANLTGSPLPAIGTNFVGYLSATTLVGQLTTAGVLTVRAMAAQLASDATCYLRGSFICE